VTHRLIHASAGTGKTWQLSGRYLELLFAGVEPRAILATTFTRKAAGEIQDRVLERLARAAVDPQARRLLGEQIDRELSAAQVEELLASLTRRLDQMRVRTLDAFFVHLGRLFALELGLPPEWSIADDAEERILQREAVARTLATTERTELLLLLRGLQRADASRTVEYTLLREVEHGRDAFLESHPDAWRRVVPPNAVEPDELADALERVRSAELPETKDGRPRAAWRRAQSSIVAAVEARDWKRLVELLLVARIAEGQEDFDGKPIPPGWIEPVQVLLQQAAHEIVSEVVAFNAAARTWLERFEERFDELKAEERVYRFEDLPKALHPRDESRLGALEQIWYRLDGRLDHLLLDEFQDTAPVQWRILSPLAEEILADGTGRRSFFCVGDLKQSIYGFREAEPRLLASMEDLHPALVRSRLDRSWRSSPIVLAAVDQVFSTIGTNAAFEREEHRQAASDFQADYGPHEAVNATMPGAVLLLEAPPAEPEERAFRALELAAARVAALVHEAPGASIAILLRRNEYIARTIFLLRDHGVRASGEGGNPLTDSAAVLHFLSLLHLSDHPGDSAAAFHVATSPLAAAVGLSQSGFLRERGPVAESVRARLAREGYGAFAASFLAAVDAGYGAWDRSRFRQLVDLAYAHEQRSVLRAGRFVDHVRLTRVEDPAATQVQVMTVHSAKGLEFDAVILPELDGPFLPQRTQLLTERPDPAGLVTAVSRAPLEQVCRLEGTLERLWIQQERRELREALCLLYVAMTRARSRLEMIVQHRKPGDIPHTFAGVLRAAFGVFAPGEGGLLWAHEENASSWFVAPAREDVAVRPPPRPAPFRAVTTAPLAHRTPSASEGAGKRATAALLRSPRSPARIGGELVHRWLAAVEWLEDFRATDEELLAAGARTTADERLSRKTLALLRGFLAAPNTRAALSRPSGPTTVWRERAFSLVLPEPDGSEALWSGAFDRVVLHGTTGSWSSAEVIDFKTDEVDASGLDARVELYRPQLEGYRRVLARMTGLAEERIAARLLFLQLDHVRTL